MWHFSFLAVQFGMKTGRSADVNETLQINPKFEQIIPPLTADEFAQLEENIIKLGRKRQLLQYICLIQFIIVRHYP